MTTSKFAIQVDELQVARARRGDHEAMESLYRTFAEPVYTLCLRVCASVEEAEDAHQETFIKLFQRIEQYRADAPFWSWVRKIALNTALSRLKKSQDKMTSIDEYGDLSLVMEKSAEHPDHAVSIDLEKKLSQLPQEARTVVWLHAVEGYTHTEIAQMMGKTESYSKSQLSRAYQKLRKWLKWHRTAEETIRKQQIC